MGDGLSIGGAIEGAQGYGGWSLFFLALIWWIKGVPERSRASTEAVAALHQDYDVHIQRLQSENSGLRDRLQAVEESRDADRRECIRETDELREMIRELTKHVDGLQRDIAQHSNSTAHLLGDIVGKGA